MSTETIKLGTTVQETVKTLNDNFSDVEQNKANKNEVILTAQKGAAGGVATLTDEGKIPAMQLPAFVDDILQMPVYESAPENPAAGDQYINERDALVYTYNGTAWDNGAEASRDVIYILTIMEDTETTEGWYKYSGGGEFLEITANGITGVQIGDSLLNVAGRVAVMPKAGINAQPGDGYGVVNPIPVTNGMTQPVGVDIDSGRLFTAPGGASVTLEKFTADDSRWGVLNADGVSYTLTVSASKATNIPLAVYNSSGQTVVVDFGFSDSGGNRLITVTSYTKFTGSVALIGS